MIIYCITNNLNGKRYIGLDRNSNKRWAEHKRRSRADNPTQLIDHKLKHYGVDNFTYSVLAECDDIETLKALEQKFIKALGTYAGLGRGYNLTSGGDGCVDFKFRPEQIKNKGASHYMYGRKQSAESNRKRSEAMKRHRAKTVNPFTLPEVRAKVGQFAKQRTGEANPNYKHGLRVGVNT